MKIEDLQKYLDSVDPNNISLGLGILFNSDLMDNIKEGKFDPYYKITPTSFFPNPLTLKKEACVFNFYRMENLGGKFLITSNEYIINKYAGVKYVHVPQDKFDKIIKLLESYDKA